MSVKVEANNKIIEVSLEAFVYIEDKENHQADRYIDGEELPKETWEELEKWIRNLENLIKEFPLSEKK